MTEPFFFASSPVFSVDGSDVGELARDIVRLQIDDSLEGMKSLSARFVAIGPVPGKDAEGLLYLDGRHVDFGRKLAVSLGPPSLQRTLFEGTISALEIRYEEAEEPEFCLHAEDRLMELRMTRRSKTYEEVSDADIVADIASAHGLTADTDVEGPTYDRIQQFNMSDLAFLRERARLLQADLWIDGDRLAMKTRDRRSGTEITLIRGTDLLSVRASADLAHQRTAVHVCGYDAAARAVIDEQSDDAAVRAELNGGRSGAEILSAALGERISRRVAEVPIDASEAADWARAEMLRRARGFVTVSGMTRGTPDMVVGSQLTLEQVGPPFDGRGYYVTRVRHTYDLTEGHRTEFEAERASVGPMP